MERRVGRSGSDDVVNTDGQVVSERTPLSPSSSSVRTSDEEVHDGSVIPQSHLWLLYVSHGLSTWNMRSYEFAVILLFAAAYPDSMRPTSIRGVLTNLSTFLFSPAVGRWVDNNASRFNTIQRTIVLQRLAIVLACLLWIGVFVSADNDPASIKETTAIEPPSFTYTSSGGASSSSTTYSSAASVIAIVKGSISIILVSLIVLLSILERLCAVANQFVMERDWVPTLASPHSTPALHVLNATMRRIDLLSKICAPVAVSAIKIRARPETLAAAIAILNAGTVALEWLTAKKAWERCQALRMERGDVKTLPFSSSGEEEEDSLTGDRGGRMVEMAEETREKGLRLYFRSDVCLPSLSMALQSFTVLSLSGPMTTYLLTRHYSLSLITTARTLTSLIEISSTVIYPLGITLLSRPFIPSVLQHHAVSTLGLFGITWQLLLLVPTFVALVLVPTTSPTPAASYPMLTVCIFAFLGLSRLGNWVHNLSAQQIVQTHVPAKKRVEFSGVEMTFVSGAEIGRWACGIVWDRPEEFKGVAGAGLASAVVCWALFAGWYARGMWRYRRYHALREREE